MYFYNFRWTLRLYRAATGRACLLSLMLTDHGNVRHACFAHQAQKLVSRVGMTETQSVKRVRKKHLFRKVEWNVNPVHSVNRVILSRNSAVEIKIEFAYHAQMGFFLSLQMHCHVEDVEYAS